jgi:hypothetical protein
MTPEKVVEILKAHGTLVTIDEAKVILIYLTQLAEFEVSDFIRLEKEKKFSTIDKNNRSD